MKDIIVIIVPNSILFHNCLIGTTLNIVLLIIFLFYCFTNANLNIIKYPLQMSCYEKLFVLNFEFGS